MGLPAPLRILHRMAGGMHLALYIAAGIVLAAAITVGTLLRGRRVK